MKYVAISLLLLSTSALAQSRAQAEFTQLKSLAGSWEGKTSQTFVEKGQTVDTRG